MLESIPGMVDPAIFEDLQAKIDEDTAFRDEIKDIVQTLEKQGNICSKSPTKPMN